MLQILPVTRWLLERAASHDGEEFAKICKYLDKAPEDGEGKFLEPAIFEVKGLICGTRLSNREVDGQRVNRLHIDATRQGLEIGDGIIWMTNMPEAISVKHREMHARKMLTAADIIDAPFFPAVPVVKIDKVEAMTIYELDQGWRESDKASTWSELKQQMHLKD